MSMTISQLAKSGGVGVETVRFYQRKGLIADPKPASVPGASGRKHYGDEDTRRLSFIRSAKSAGFTLDEIGKLLQLDRISDRAEIRSMAEIRIAALDERLLQLTQSRVALAKLSQECGSSRKGACPIIEAFEN